MRVGIVNHVPICRVGGEILVNPSEYLGLKPWIHSFDSVLLLKPEVIGGDTSSWEALPEKVESLSLFSYSIGQHRLARMKWMARGSNISRGLSKVDGLYFRIPNWESFRIWGAARKNGLPTLLEIHGDGEEAILANEYQGIGRMLRAPHARWHRHATAAMAREADVLCCWGQALGDKYGQKRQSHIMSPHHLGEASFFMRDRFKREGPFKIVYVGPLQNRKGVRYLIKAIELLQESNVPVTLDIIGSGDRLNELLRYSASLHLKPETVAFRGQLPFNLVMAAYREADLFVLPAIAADSVNRSIHEAMANSCPVVSTYVGSIPQQLEHGRLGFLVPPGEAQYLARVIGIALTDPDVREQKARGAFAVAKRSTYEEKVKQIGGIVKEFERALYQRATKKNQF